MPFVLSVRTITVTITAVAGTLAASLFLSSGPHVDMRLSPLNATLGINDEVTVNVIVETNTPANAFTGEVIFDNTRFAVVDIAYNTSIANLWVTEPWYSRGDNTIYFAGGTTVTNGFVGEGILMSITLRALSVGDTVLTLENIRILAHDGLGSDLPVETTIDALFTAAASGREVVSEPEMKTGSLTIIPITPSLDLTGDGVVSFQDVSVLLLNLNSTDARYDFNSDGVVNWSDVRIWQQLRSR